MSYRLWPLCPSREWWLFPSGERTDPPRGQFSTSSRKRADGLRLAATDVEWSHGEGPEVHGTGEAILLALTGRPVVLDELTGDGVATLRARIAA